MHDAAEAYIGDLVAPVKKLCPDYKDIEEMVEAEIAEIFNLKFPMPPCIKEADIVAVVTEKRDLLEGGSWGYYEDIKPYPHVIIPLCWEDAYVEFIERAEDLGLI
jgi:5'-deoxynucleotidase YfbR-like HD superfamily hydrolase